MRKLFIGFIKWTILLTVMVGLVFVGLHYYKNRQIIFSFVGDQNHYYSYDHKDVSYTIGYCDRNAAWSIYAPISFRDGQGNYQLVKFADNTALWNALETNKIAFALVTLDQFALNGPRHHARLLTEYAISTGKDGVVCAKSWNQTAAGQPRRVACVNDSTSEYIAQNLANKFMDSASTPIEVVSAPDATTAQALLTSGQVEALATSEPALSELQAKGYELVPGWEAPPISEVVAIKSWSDTRNSIVHFQPHAEFIANWLYRYALQQDTMGPLYTVIARTGNLKRPQVQSVLNGLQFVGLSEINPSAQLGLQLKLKTMIEFWMMNFGTEAPFAEQQNNPHDLLADAIILNALSRYIPANSVPSAPSTRDDIGLEGPTDPAQLNLNAPNTDVPNEATERTLADPFASIDNASTEAPESALNAPPADHSATAQTEPVETTSNAHAEPSNNAQTTLTEPALNAPSANGGTMTNAATEPSESLDPVPPTPTQAHRKRLTKIIN